MTVRTGYIVAGIVAACLLLPLMCCGGGLFLGMLRPTSQVRAPRVAVTPRAKADPELQAKRAEMISKLMKEDVLQKITAGTVPKAYVLRRWQTLTLDQKQDFASLWAAYAFELPIGGRLGFADYLSIRDAYTGKELGTFSDRGLRLE